MKALLTNYSRLCDFCYYILFEKVKKYLPQKLFIAISTKTVFHKIGRPQTYPEGVLQPQIETTFSGLVRNTNTDSHQGTN